MSNANTSRSMHCDLCLYFQSVLTWCSAPPLKKGKGRDVVALQPTEHGTMSNAFEAWTEPETAAVESYQISESALGVSSNGVTSFPSHHFFDNFPSTHTSELLKVGCSRNARSCKRHHRILLILLGTAKPYCLCISAPSFLVFERSHLSLSCPASPVIEVALVGVGIGGLHTSHKAV